MRCYILTGISRKVIEDIVKRAIRTIELRSAHNVATALNIELGSCVFLTPCRHFDLDKGALGVIAEVNGKESQSHSLIFASERYIEESEMTVVRLKITPKGIGRIKSIYRDGILESTEGDVVEVTYFTAR
ncbi:MAG TPA: DUF473 domain-containing protein [Archaeoglobaceae archaeon]|nr:DUF473 domain-containing protein [Archaeoglobaceae archaeon]